MAEQKPKAGSLHEGHRQRMKARFLAGGLQTFSDHEILELLLYYALPYRDTNDLAHLLADRFGGWTQVLDAHYDDLLAVPGVTPHVATLLTLVGQAACRYLQDQNGKVLQLYDAEALARHILPLFMGAKSEKVLLVSLDNKRKHLNTTCVYEGSINAAQFNIRDVVQQALRDNATQVVLAHNHPSGFAFPSRPDIHTTQRLAEVLRPLDIRLIDHLVVAEGDCLCLSSLPETQWVFEDTEPPVGWACVASC